MTVTIKQVAEQSGVSWPTVSRILNNKGGRFRSETRKRVQRMAEELGYRPHAAARTMRNQRSMQIGVLLRNAPDRPFHYLSSFEIILGINARLEASDYVLSLVRFDDVSEDRASLSRVFREHLLDGMIVLGAYSEPTYHRVAELAPRCVWLETNHWGDDRCIRRDEHHTGELVIAQAAALGYRQVVWVGPLNGVQPIPFSVPQRYQAVTRACRQHGIELQKVTIERRGRKLLPGDLTGLLKPQIALVAYNTQLALVVAQQAAALGCRPGVDYGLMCCDEDQTIFETWPGLSRVGNDRYGMGRQAAEMMLGGLERPAAPCPSQLLKGQWMPGNTAWGPKTGQHVENNTMVEEYAPRLAGGMG